MEKIPNEILNEILRATSGWPPAPGCYDWLLKLMLVCKRWHAAVMADASLWCSISMDCSPRLISQVLERSKNKPLRIDCYLRCSEDVDDDPSEWPDVWVREFFDQVSQTIHRWLSLSITVLNNDLKPFAAMLETPAPSLQAAYVDRVGEGGTGSPLDLFNHQADNLSRIQLQGVSVRWDLFRFSALQSLTLLDMDNGPSEVQIYNILKDCPRLESFEAYNVETGDSGFGRKPPRIALPYLRTLRVGAASSKTWGAIIERIGSLPSCQTFNIEFGSPEDSVPTAPTFLSATLSHLHDHLIQMFTAPLGLYLFGHESVGLRSLSGLSPSQIWFSGGIFMSEHLLEWALPIISAVPQRLPIVLTVSISQPLEAICLTRSLKIVTLEIKTQHRGTPSQLAVQAGYIALLDALGGRGLGEWDGSFAFPFLKLIRLQIDEGHVSGNELLEMIRRRWAVVTSSKEAIAMVARGQAVRPFKVSFNGRKGNSGLIDIMRRVAEVIGTGNVLFSGTLFGMFAVRRAPPPYNFEHDQHRNPSLRGDEDN